MVDDNERALDIVTRRFASLGQRVVARNSLDGAIEALQEALAAGGPFDICILDATMIAEDGCGTIEELRRLCGEARCAVVGIALLIGREATKCVHGHFDAHLHKPVRRKDCIDLLRACAEGAGSANPPDAPEATPGGAPDSTASVPGEGAASEDRTIRILLAEDNPVNQKLAKLLLEKAGYVVEVASNGKEAVEMFVAAPDSFNLIFMDIQMPLLDGLEATKDDQSERVLRDSHRRHDGARHERRSRFVPASRDDRLHHETDSKRPSFSKWSRNSRARPRKRPPPFDFL